MCKFKKAIYDLKQSPRARFNKFKCAISKEASWKFYSDPSVFIYKISSGAVIFAIYVDEILLTRSDVDGIEKVKEYLMIQFVTKNMGRPRYFLGIVAHSKDGLVLS